MNIAEWHNRYRDQANWTLEARKFILSEIDLPENPTQIEIGSGTGIILDQTESLTGSRCLGLDINWHNLKFNKTIHPTQKLIMADGYTIPLNSEYFDFVLCHYLVLWIKDPVILFNEMKRITKKGGWICCFAEPDYLGRIDFPIKHQRLGNEQNLGLLEQGIRLDTGRKLAYWMEKTGLSNIYWGIIGSHQSLRLSKEKKSKEWSITKNDLSFKYPPEKVLFEQQQYIDNNAEESAISFIPTFYAYAQII
jgi:SAM-dependent methyltransferase